MMSMIQTGEFIFMDGHHCVSGFPFSESIGSESDLSTVDDIDVYTTIKSERIVVNSKLDPECLFFI